MSNPVFRHTSIQQSTLKWFLTYTKCLDSQSACTAVSSASIQHNNTGTSTVTCNTQQTQLTTNPPLSWPSTCSLKDTHTLFKNRPCKFIVVLSHYDAHSCCCHFTHNITTQTNSIPRITTSAATGARLTTLRQPVDSIISVQLTGARTYCRHVDSAAQHTGAQPIATLAPQLTLTQSTHPG